MGLTQAVKSLSALAQESRLAVYKLLVQAGPAGLAAGIIAEQLGISASGLSFHMKELTYAGLVTSRTEGRYVIYSAEITHMNLLLAYLQENCCGGNPCSPILQAACAPQAERF